MNIMGIGSDLGEGDEVFNLLKTTYGNDVQENLQNMSRLMKTKQQLNIMVCGQAGIGKTSFIKLFLKKYNLDEAQKLLKSNIL